jgi:hypothetical protein
MEGDVPIENNIPSHLNMRIEPRLRYLTELAARARNMSLTEYIEAALEDSFSRVSADQYPELVEEPNVYALSPAERREKFRKRQSEVRHPLSEVADRLWSEHPIVRIQLIALAGLDHLMSDDDKHIWRHIVNRSPYMTKDGKLDLKAIEKDWVKIRFMASSDLRKARGEK